MRTGLTKQQKTTEIFFNETKIGLSFTPTTHNLKERPTVFADQYPDHCIMTDEDIKTGYKSFEIDKGRLSFRLTAPYREERRQDASYRAKLQGTNLTILNETLKNSRFRDIICIKKT